MGGVDVSDLMPKTMSVGMMQPYSPMPSVLLVARNSATRALAAVLKRSCRSQIVWDIGSPQSGVEYAARSGTTQHIWTGEGPDLGGAWDSNGCTG